MSSTFGEEFEKIWPVTSPQFTEFGQKLLQDCKNISKPNALRVEVIVENSAQFPVAFPINSCRISSQPKVRWSAIQEQAAHARPVIHEKVLWLYLRFLEHKCEHGTRIEKEIYSKMSLAGFVTRLLEKRCVSFYGRLDTYLLLTGEKGKGGHDFIGTTKEAPPLILKNCLSYDEIKLSALLSVSSHSEFLNNGNRNNEGKIESNKSKIETEGVIMGIIGARLTRAGLMECQDILITETQNTIENGYGTTKPSSSAEVDKKFDCRQMWNTFYDENGVLYKDVQKDQKRFGEARKPEAIFDNLMMKKRYTISFDTLLLESEARAAAANKRAYVHVVGIGLGVWRAAEHQEEVFLQTFSQRLKTLLPKLQHVSFVHFSWFQLSECGDIKNGNLIKSEDHPDGGIKVFISRRNPADKLVGPEFKNTLPFISYAWDGNSLPGNEFWMGLLRSTGDPAAACSTLITELHNAHINKGIISGNNLHVASEAFGVIHIAEYAKLKSTA